MFTKTKKLILSLLLLLPMLFSISAYANQGAIQTIKDRGVLRVGVFSDKPPFGYIDQQGQNQGYDIELGKRLAKDLLGDETKVQFVLTEAQHRVDVLKSNKVDITIANFTITPERATQVDFALPYMKTAVGVASKKANPITDPKQLKNQRLVVIKGTTAEILFIKQYPKVKLLKYDHNSEGFAALTDGRALGLSHDNTLLYAWVKANPDFTVSINQIGPDDLIAPAVKKGNKELLDWLNAEITQLRNEEFFHKAYDKTIRPFYATDVDPDNVVIDASNL